MTEPARPAFTPAPGWPARQPSEPLGYERPPYAFQPEPHTSMYRARPYVTGPVVVQPSQPPRHKKHTGRIVGAVAAVVSVLVFIALAAGMAARSGYKPADPAGVTACVNAWTKLHDDGVTARVLRLGAAGNESAEAVELGNASDVDKGAVCGTLTAPDDAYATKQINAKTGDDYKPGKAAS